MRNGRRKSFTVNDPSRKGKAECERMAAQWAASEALEKAHRSVQEQIEDYIAYRSKSLSVTTLAAYRSLARNAFDGIGREPDSREIQRWIDELSETHSPKTVANAYGLLTAATGEKYKVRLPERKKHDFATPTDDNIKELLADVQGTDMERAILLAAFGTLRLGEVCALTKDDIDGQYVTVSKSMAWDGKGYVIKDPKTPDSVRTVALPKKVIDVIIGSESIVDRTPKQISQAFARLVRKHGMRFRFHDLRAYSASIRHALGIPDQYIMADGGWKTDSVLKKVYRRAMEDKRKEFSEITNRHFEELI